MKFRKKCFIYLLVSVFFVGSIILSYEKANSVHAVSAGVGVTAAVFIVGLGLLGAYCVSSEETRDEIKQSFTDYKNMTVEGAKKAYEINKQLFNDFVAYAEANGASSACLYSAAGSSYSVAELSQAGFPEFDAWDDYFKKASSSGSGGGWKNMLDKFMLAADLIGLMKSFCNDEFYPDGINGQLFYAGEDGYVNAETGELNVYFESRMYEYDENTFNTYEAVFNGNVDDLVSAGSDYGDFRICAYPKKEYSYNTWHNIPNGFVLNDVWRIDFIASYRHDNVNGGVKNVFIPYLDVSYNGGTAQKQNYTFGSFGLKYFDSSALTNYLYNIDSGYYDEELGRYLSYKDFPYFPDYISANIPFFATYSDAYNYLVGNDKKPTNSLGTTPSDAFIDNYSNQYITTVNIINDVTGDDVEPTVTPAGDSTVTPFPTLTNDDGSNTTNNYIINITNVLQPIQQSITNIYNFFVIDTDRILPELAIDFVPAEKFQKITEVASVLQSSVPADSHDKSGALVAEYPKITIEVPKILVEYIGDSAVEMDGKLVIVLCDFKDYAILFVRFRGFLAATIWLGMIFYILKQFEVTFSIN